MTGRWHKLERFTGDDEVRVVSVPAGGAPAGKFTVYARETAGAGTSTVAVRGAFDDGGTDGTSVQITGATSTGAGTLTVITAATDTAFPFLVIKFDATGDSDVNVYISVY